MAGRFDKDLDLGEGYELTMERCRGCEHFEGFYRPGPPYNVRVFCQGVKRYSPTPRITWVIKELCGAYVNSIGKLVINCGDYKKAKPIQTRMEV